MPTKIKKANKLELAVPEIATLARDIGGEIYRRGKTYWLDLNGDDIQLTFTLYQVEGGPAGQMARLPFKDQAGVVRNILKRLKDEQGKWGSPYQRAMGIIKGLQDEVVPNWKPQHYCYYRGPGGDNGVLFQAFGEASMWLNLCGLKKIEVRAKSFVMCLKMLTDEAANLEGGE